MTFKDDVSDVRFASCSALQGLMEATGADYVKSHIFPILKSLHNTEYLRRLTMLRALSALLQANPSEPFLTEALSLALSALNDSVPNIRLCLSQVPYTSRCK